MKYVIPGNPIGKPRMTQRDKWQLRPCVVRYRAWSDAARLAVGFACKQEAPHQIVIRAYMEMPKSWSKKRRLRTGMVHQQTPDIDNIVKAVLDSLFHTDQKVWYLEAGKYWEDSAGPRLEVYF